MLRDKNSVKNIVMVAFSVCLVCAIVVSAAAVSLRPLQVANAELDRKRNVLLAAGILQPGLSIDEQFERIETRIVHLDSGRFVDDMDPNLFNQRAAARNPETSRAISSREDIAGLNRREDHSLVYMVRDEAGELDILILPVRAYGLWSTMYGFLALDNDLNTVLGLGFYDHAETPGLGGEIDNPNWLAQWPGRQVYDQNGNIALRVSKGTSVEEEYRIDSLSGATLTSRGVDNMLAYWMSGNGFEPLLNQLRMEGS